MAASLKRMLCIINRDKWQRTLSILKPVNRHVARLSSKSNPDHETSKHCRTTVSCNLESENALLFWHPEPNFPYEHTQPIPRKVSEIAEGDTVLKVQYLQEEKVKLRPDGPTDEELSNIFYETKHRWYPKPEKKYRKVNPPKDRDSM